MKPYQLYEIAVRRGDAKHIDREMGYHTNGEIARRWRRPYADADNLFTGQPAPLVKGKQEILAHDRVNPEAADILLFDLFASVALQRAGRAPVTDHQEQTRLEVMHALAQGFLTACEALAGQLTQDEQEEKLWRAGGAVVRAILFVMHEETDAAQGQAAA